ncbi:MAG: Bug family tripartite tricarboxylate transporter substrate binding protein [Burkholderiales bacterium]
MLFAKFVASLSLCTFSAVALAQSGPYPNRPIRVVVPYSPGTGSDVLARTLGKVVSEKVAQPVVIENRDGGGSLLGTMAVAKAPADGYTLLIAANPFVIVPSQHVKPPYDPLNDFVPVAKVGVIPLVLAAAPGVPFANLKELVAYAKANPGKLSYASSGAGTISQQEMELFKQAAGLDIVEVGYKSTAQAMNDVLGAQIPLFPVVVPLVMPHLKSGRVKALALFDIQRSAIFPEIPLMAEELGVADYTPTPVWYGFMAPAGTPREIVTALNGYFHGAMQTAEVKERLAGLGAQVNTPTNEQFASQLKAEFEKAARVARMLGTAK